MNSTDWWPDRDDLNCVGVSLSLEVVEQLAVRLGLSFDEAERIVVEHGRVIRDLLAQGKAVGIPVAGLAIYTACQPRRVCSNFSGQNKQPVGESRFDHYRRLQLWVPRTLRPCVRDSAPSSRDLMEQSNEARVRYWRRKYPGAKARGQFSRRYQAALQRQSDAQRGRGGSGGD